MTPLQSGYSHMLVISNKIVTFISNKDCLSCSFSTIPTYIFSWLSPWKFLNPKLLRIYVTAIAVVHENWDIDLLSKIFFSHGEKVCVATPENVIVQHHKVEYYVLGVFHCLHCQGCPLYQWFSAQACQVGTNSQIPCVV